MITYNEALMKVLDMTRRHDGIYAAALEAAIYEHDFQRDEYFTALLQIGTQTDAEESLAHCDATHHIPFLKAIAKPLGIDCEGWEVE